jgi:23S rRNA (uracil1939-C5)-methyltransferase
LGEALAEFEGQSIFVLGGIPGEKVVAEVVSVRRKYAAARVVEVVEPSAARVPPPCPYYGDCTGCQWQHLSYREQLEVKREHVKDALKRVGGLSGVEVAPVAPSPREFGYRNHARFTIGPGGALGFVHKETRRFVRIDRCMLMHDGVNETLAGLQDKCSETTQLSVRAGMETGDMLIQPALRNPDITFPTGQKTYRESVAGHEFRVASPSFFQVNIEQTARLAGMVRDILDLTQEDVLLDAYTGVGTFAVLLSPFVKRVIAVEESAAAMVDARENAKGLDNIELVTGKTEDVLPGLRETLTAAILDPPRAGCHPRTLESLVDLGPSRIAYVSCDPGSLARDLKLLCETAYSVESVTPLDMFPQTHHIECVAFLRRKRQEREIVLASFLRRKRQEREIVLASASPRRRELLFGMGLEFQVSPANVLEEPLPGESPGALVRRLSRIKAEVVASGVDRGFVIGADSMVVHEGEAMGKPVDREDARGMLRQLRGTRHEVFTGITVIEAESGRSLTDSMASDITLRDFSDQEMEQSIASGTPMDKAGAYAVQDREFQPAESWEGCYTNIVGLPLCRLIEMLAELGWKMTGLKSDDVPPECGPHCPFQGERTP